MSALKEQTRKQLVSQTSEAIFNKLKKGSLLGISKTVGIEILTERKAKGKFDGDLSEFEEGKETKKEEKSAPKAPVAEKAKKEKDKKTVETAPTETATNP